MSFNETLSPYFSDTGVSEGSIKMLMPLFFKEIQVGIESVKLLNKEKNERELREVLHKMKGTSLSYGASIVVKRIELLQSEVRERKWFKTELLVGSLEEAVIDSMQTVKITYPELNWNN